MTPAGAEERRLRAALGVGEPNARASVTFLGTERVEVLRFLAPDRPDGPGGAGTLLHYAALGETTLVLSLRAGRLPLETTDGVLRPLAVVAASPQVDDVTLAPGAALDLGEPLWPGASFTAVLLDRLGEAETEAEGAKEEKEEEKEEGAGEEEAPAASHVLRLLPMTPAEAAWRRVRGTPSLREHWRRHGAELRDPLRRAVAPMPLTE